MSYEIVYGKQFIKTSRGIIPLVLSGSNNCTELLFNGREVRERHWSCFYHTMKEHTEKDLMDRVNSFIPSDYQQHFMQGSKWVDDAGVIKFFKNGIKSAKTIEEIILTSKNVHDLAGCVVVYVGNTRTTPERVSIKTTSELEDFMDRSQLWLKDKKPGEEIYISLSFGTRLPIKFKDVAVKLPAGRCIIKNGKKYITEISKRSFSYCGDITQAIIFESGEDAARSIAENELRRDLKIVAYKENKDAERIAVRIEYEDGDTSYFLRMTKNGYKCTHYQSGAKVFNSSKVAQKFVSESTMAKMKSYYQHKIKDLVLVTL